MIFGGKKDVEHLPNMVCFKSFYPLFLILRLYRLKTLMRLMEKAVVGTVSYKRKSSQKNYVEKRNVEYRPTENFLLPMNHIFDCFCHC